MAISEDEQLKKMRLEILDDVTDSSLDEIFLIKLNDAKFRYLRLVYPFDHDIEELPNDRAKNWQTNCAIELYRLYELGDEANYAQYSENGLSYARAKAGLSQDLLNELPPAKAGVPIDEKRVE